MTSRPEFVDNLDGNTLARALQEVFGAAEETSSDELAIGPDIVRIASAYFNPSGFTQVSDRLRAVPEVRLLLGADAGVNPPGQRRRLEETETMFAQRQLRDGLARTEGALLWERDRLPFNRTSGTALRTLVEALRGGNLEVRRYERAFLHAKAYIFDGMTLAEGRSGGILAGSSNFTRAGLARNLELNLGRYEAPVVERAVQWYDALWEDAEPYDLSGVFEEALRPRTPWEIFMRVLWQLYGEEIEEDAAMDEGLPLTNFQKHGVARALRLIRDTGGAIVADEVGLGKTFIAGEVLQIYRERRQRALLVCPASLRDTTWRTFLTRFELFVECLSFEELASDRQLSDEERPTASQEKLQRPLDEYQLVVVDEAHNYRNPDTPTRAAVLRRLLFGRRRRDVLLLTATPVNNSLWDLYHLMRFFVRQDAHFADQGILSVRRRFERAMREDPASLSPDVLYPIIDGTTVKRTRQFVRKHYPGDMITGPDGNPVQIVFPQPRAISVRYDLDALLPGFFDQLGSALDPDSDEAIGFHRYWPDAFRIGPGERDEEFQARALIGLLRSMLLKRFESSAYAFRETLRKMIREHNVFLDALDAGYVVTTKFMRELSADDEGILEDLLDGTTHSAPADLYDVEALRAAVTGDRDRLRILAGAVADIRPEHDPKLAALTEALAEIVEQAERDATDGADEAQKRKVLVFSFFEDTVTWIRDFLTHALDTRPELAVYRGRMAAVSGSGKIDKESRHATVQGFAPISMEAPGGKAADRFDLLLSTDVLAEGVNLQQCRHIVNYDVPWNPMRLVQRHGRIDRIGSPHPRVFMRTIFPADRLDELLKLEQRILAKLAMAAASVGVAAPIEGAAHGAQVFTETRDEIEKLLHEDASIYERGGTEGAAQTGEEYRQALRKALEEDRDGILGLPWKAGSGMVKGVRSGMFFCAVVGKRTYLRFVAATEEWEVSGADDAMLREVGTCLRLIECEPGMPASLSAIVQERVYDFWEAAQADIFAEWSRETDPANLQPKVRPLNHRVAAHIRSQATLDLDGAKVTLALEILESPWPRREEVLLREWFGEAKDTGAAGVGTLIERVLATGLEPVKPPPPLPPIELEDIEVLCWLAVEAAVNYTKPP